MDKYFYFRNATDEAADLTALNSVTVPVDSITGITPLSGNTSVAITFKSLKGEKRNGYVDLQVVQGRIQEVIQQLVEAMYSGPSDDGFVVVADTVVTTDGATSIQGNDQTVPAKFLSGFITGINSIVTL